MISKADPTPNDPKIRNGHRCGRSKDEQESAFFSLSPTSCRWLIPCDIDLSLLLFRLKTLHLNLKDLNRVQEPRKPSSLGVDINISFSLEALRVVRRLHFHFEMLQIHLEVAVGAIAGIVSHCTFFVHNEHDLAAASIARCYIALFILIPTFGYALQDLDFKESVIDSLPLEISYTVALFASITIYILFVSPLKVIPGPFHLSLTKLTHVWGMARTQNCKLLHRYHNLYGDIVRTGIHIVSVVPAPSLQKQSK